MDPTKLTKGHRVATVVTSTVVLVSGIIVGSLLYSIIQTAVAEMENSFGVDSYRYDSSTDVASTFLACFGLVYVVPAIFGIVAGSTRSKGAYIGHMVVGIISLLICVSVFFGSINELIRHKHTDVTCLDEECRSLVAMAKACLAFIIIGSVFLLGSMIHSCVLLCTAGSRTGVVVVGGPLSAPPTTTIIHAGVTMSPYPQPGAVMTPHPQPGVGAPPAYSQYVPAPTTSDQASLVENAQYGYPSKYGDRL